MRPEFSSTIFFWRWKNGMSVGQFAGSPLEPVSRWRMISGASSGVTLAYILPSDLHGDQRPGAAQPHAADAFDEHLVLHAGFGDLLLQRLADLVAAGGEAAGGDADADVVLVLGAARRARLRRSGGVPQWSWWMPFSMRASISCGADLAHHGVVHDHRRRESAGAEAARGEHGELAIGRGLAGLDAVGALERLRAARARP